MDGSVSYSGRVTRRPGCPRSVVAPSVVAPSAVVAAEAEGMASRVEEHADIVLRLVGSDRGSEGDSLRDGGVEVSDLEVEVHHRALLPVSRRPHGRLVTGRLLEHDIDGSLGSG